MDLKVSSIPKPARKSLEPSPAAWTRNLPQIYSKYWCELGTAPEATAIAAAICIAAAAAAASGAVAAVIHRETAAIRLQWRYCFYCFFHVSFAGVNLWLNCQPGVLSWDLGHLFLWLLFCKFLWGAL